MTDTLAEVKKLIGISTSDKDAQLNKIIENVQAQMRELLKGEEVPSELEFVVEEVALVRYNRLGSEGMESETRQGHSVKYALDDFKPYARILANHIPEDDGWEPGEVLLF